MFEWNLNGIWEVEGKKWVLTAGQKLALCLQIQTQIYQSIYQRLVLIDRMVTSLVATITNLLSKKWNANLTHNAWLVVTFIDKHLASIKDGGLKTVKCSYTNNNTSFWQGNISTKFIGKRVSWWQILDHMEPIGQKRWMVATAYKTVWFKTEHKSGLPMAHYRYTCGKIHVRLRFFNFNFYLAPIFDVVSNQWNL